MLFSKRTAFIAFSLHAASLFSVYNGTWNVNGNGNWGTAGNWTPGGGPPISAGDTATFGTIITSAAAITLDVSPTIDQISFDNANNYTVMAVLANTLTLTGAVNPAINITNVNGNGAHTLTTPITLGNNIVVSQASTGTFTLGGVISGAFSLTKSGNGPVLLQSANLYSAGTTISAGTLQAGIANAFPSGHALTVTAGTADLNNFNQTVTVLNGAGNVTLGTATLTVSSGTFTGVISQTGSLVKTSGGTLVLGGVNTYSGGTTVNAGVLQANVASAFPPNGVLTITSPGSVDLNSFAQTIGGLAGSGNLTMGTAQLTVNTAQNTSYSGVMSGATGSLVVGGSAQLTLTTPSTFGGGVTVNSGILQAGVANVFVTAGNENITVNSPGIFDLFSFSQTIGTLAGNGGITLGTATLTADSTTNSNFSGSITGSGSFVKTNTSTLTFSGTSNYPGGTTINNGILQMGIANALPATGPVTVTSPGALHLANFNQTIGALSGDGAISLGTALFVTNSTATTSYSGVISDTGAFAKDGTGLLTISGANDYSGGTFILGGTLQAGAVNTLPVSGDITVDNPGTLNLNNFNQTVGGISGNGSIALGTATLTTNTTETTTFSGPISGVNGVLTKQGTGTLVLLGANTYSGGTNVTGGTLAGNTVGLQGAIANSATVVFDQSFNGTFNGTFTGAGTLVKNGSGTVILAGVQAQGNTMVNGGGLAVNGTLTSPVTVGPGGTLSGTGTITGTVIVNGTLFPGGPPGTLFIVGNFTQASGSTFVGDLTSSMADMLNVTGAVTIQPNTTFTAEIMPGIYAPTTLYTLISSTGAVTGTFSHINVQFPLFNAQLLYTQGPPGSVQLSLSIAPFSTVIVGGNAGAVAKCFNQNTFTSSTDFLNIVQSMLFLPIDQIATDLERMQPSQLKGLVLVEENNCLSVRTAMQERSGDLFYTDCNIQAAEMYQWSLWSSFHGDFLDQHNEEENPGFRSRSGNATIGVDTRFAKDAVLGAAGAYSTSELHWNLQRGHGSVDSYYAGPYLSWFGKNAYLNLSSLGTWNVYHAVRNIDLSFLSRKARSTHHGFGFLAHTDTGLLFHPVESVTLGPFGAFDYVFLHENGFTEQGAQSLNLDVRSAHNDLFRSEVGLQLAKCSQRRYVKWIHHLQASWVYEYRIFGKHYEAGFVDQDCVFTVTGMHPNRNIFDIKTGLSALFADDHGLLSLIYEGQFGQGIKVQSGSLQFTYRF